MTTPSIMVSAVPDAHEDICNTVEAICRKFPAKYWRNLEDAPLSERYPGQFVDELEQAGILGAGVGEEHGGVGLSMGALARVVETIHANGSNGDPVAEQFALMLLLASHGSQAARSEVLPAMAEGRARLQSLAVWERDSGRDLDRIATTAKKTADGYVIEGRKRWVRFAEHTTYMLVAARTAPGPRGLALFLVDLPTNRDRMTIQPTAAMNNYGASEVAFEGVMVPERHLVGPAGDAASCLDDLDTARGILAAAAGRGCSRFFCSKGVKYANERVVFGNPIGQYQGIQFPLAQTYMESEGAALLLDLAIALYDQGRDCYSEARMAWHMAVQAAWDTADAAFTTHGGFAFAREYDVERKWREVRFMRNDAVTALQQVADTSLGTSAS